MTVAVSFNNSGVPIQIFTVNRWVAEEWQYPADTVISLIDKFVIEQPIKGHEKYGLTSRWLMASRARCGSCLSGSSSKLW